MIGEIIAIGDELTSGRILNTTSYFAASQLFAAGHEVVAMTTVGDDPGLIGRTLLNSLERAEFVIVTGGLGATTDDMTSEAVADALDRPSIFHPDILDLSRHAEFKIIMGEVYDMRAPITEHAQTIKMERAPVKWMILTAERFHFGRPAP